MKELLFKNFHFPWRLGGAPFSPLNRSSYTTSVETMSLDMIHREKAPYWVTVDGKEIPHFLHRRKFEETDCGWYYSQTLKSVLVKYPNPKRDYQVVVSFEQFDLIGM